MFQVFFLFKTASFLAVNLTSLHAIHFVVTLLELNGKLSDLKTYIDRIHAFCHLIPNHKKNHSAVFSAPCESLSILFFPQQILDDGQHQVGMQTTYFKLLFVSVL